MASSFEFLLLLGSFLLLANQFQAQAALLPNPVLLLPVTKDLANLQYVTTMYRGTPLGSIKLVVDLGGPFLWVDCPSGPLSASSHPIPSCSLQCSSAKASDKEGKVCSFGAWVSHQHRSCDLSVENSVTLSAASGELVEDVVAFRSVDGSETSGSSITTVDQFLYSCASSFLLNGLASGVQGMLGLGRTRIGLPSQLAAAFGSHRKFSTCLSSSDGVILLGDLPGDSISRSLMYTPLATNPSGSSPEYFINVKSIKVNSKRLSLNRQSIGEAKLSTIVPYTTLESSIYSTFVRAYLQAATSMNITRVAPVAPFSLCFRSERVANTKSGPVVPTIDLVLQSEMVKWRIQGRNSMVAVSDEVMCLGFLDGGSTSKAPIVLGGLQLEDVLLEFDLGASMLGFSSSLLLRETSCSKFTAKYSMLRESS